MNKIRALTTDEETRKTYLFFKEYLTENEENELRELMDKPHEAIERLSTDSALKDAVIEAAKTYLFIQREGKGNDIQLAEQQLRDAISAVSGRQK